jgi:preprotein translocase subunit SecA
MFNFITRILNYNEREIARLRKKVDEINNLEDKARDLKDSQFAEETKKLKKQIAASEKTLDEILPWAYALVREAARRILNQRHYDVQLMAGIALHERKIVEQKTGEGKTQTATLALYLNALTGKGVHLVTVNDYLARVGVGWMGPIFHFLGMSTSAMIADASYIFDPEYIDSEAADWRLIHLKPITRKEAYAVDVTYGINSEFGFDYLRDNMASTKDQRVQRGFHFAIIDEADSVLIDEARTPHIISAPFEQDVTKYYKYAKIVKQLIAGTDYIIDEKLRTANLSDAGISHIEQIMGVQNIYEKDFDTLFHLEAALKAETLFQNDKEYIVKDNEVVIVDEFTGRLLAGRRFSAGLHQAIEAKENVPIQRESKTLATVSLQNYFRMYEKLGGMTGTASTEAEEFNKIYKVDVVTIPTNRAMIRKDEPDMIYKTQKAKFNAVVEEIAIQYKTGRPVLVGTTSIEKNELLSRLLHQKGIPHEVLNAKNHVREANIISNAGMKGAVTVATNMAGRGVDIILGGNPPSEYDRPHSAATSSTATLGVNDETFNKEKAEWQKRHDEVIALGGLYVMGTERHESRRIDNQLRGRAGRQGDPGETRFFVSLEDDLMRIFGGEQISNMMTFLKFPEDQPLSHSMVSRAIEQAQVKVEGFNFDIRKHLVDFDDVLNKQREIIYSLRQKILTQPEDNTEEFKETIFGVFEEEITTLLQSFLSLDTKFTDEELQPLRQDIEIMFPGNEEKVTEYFDTHDFKGLQDYLMSIVLDHFAKKEKELGIPMWNDVIRSIYMSTIDQYWTEHLTAIEDLREGINLRGYAQLDPLIEYKNEAYSMFERLVNNVNYEFSRRLFRVEINIAPAEHTHTHNENGEIIEDAEVVPQQPFVTAPSLLEKAQYNAASQLNPYTKKEPEAKHQSNDVLHVAAPGSHVVKLGRNDPCWCGSGKKWKKCHYPALG